MMMSLQAQPIPPIPELTVQVAQKAFRKGNVYMQMRDLLGTFFTDDNFVDLYPADGQPAYSPWRLALVCVMQFAENLTDRQAADAVRSRIDWKYALSLELTDEGFDFSVLSEFRQRLLDHEAGERLLNEMLSQFQAADLLSSGGKQRTTPPMSWPPCVSSTVWSWPGEPCSKLWTPSQRWNQTG